MYNQLVSYINNYSTTPLNDSEIERIKSIFLPKKLRKRQYFLQQGEVCKYLGFVVKGALRQYSVDDRGNEHIIRLSIENWWAGDRESFTMLTPSLYYIDAWEETDLLIATQADLSTLNELPAFIETKNRLDDNHAFALQKRVNATISLSVEERYDELSKTYPEFIQRFPQHIIASYLGITKETLSRVRSKAVKK
ncbi:Crp/Fnr family transcriptional regulator [Fulvivirga ulvae]|uniref:Crp/Fnr family transcriptional regulator n=1 Tax=Fulvivirga ulvae TaxID=2904245 RepID=UPI001F1949B4|nr:Crp/Fnr family transcriptional regulator [Fulvivirga ulvae]UII29584.1 Crp/Fnr family transcriptional regulator [Fulvivirga ulvae]